MSSSTRVEISLHFENGSAQPQLVALYRTSIWSLMRSSNVQFSYVVHYLEFSLIILLKALIWKVDFQRIKVLIHRNIKNQYFFHDTVLLSGWVDQSTFKTDKRGFIRTSTYCVDLWMLCSTTILTFQQHSFCFYKTFWPPTS